MKKTEIELELLTNTDMLQIIEKGIRGGICHVIRWEAKTKNYHIKCIGAQTINTDGQCLRNYLQAILNLKKAYQIWWEFCKKLMKIVIKDTYLK